MKTIDSRNAMWIHLVLYDPTYFNFFLIPLLQNFFKERFMIKYCLMIIPPGKHNIDFFNNMGVAVLPKGGVYYLFKNMISVDNPTAKTSTLSIKASESKFQNFYFLEFSNYVKYITYFIKENTLIKKTEIIEVDVLSSSGND